jgi:hypothetical protein
MLCSGRGAALLQRGERERGGCGVRHPALRQWGSAPRRAQPVMQTESEAAGRDPLRAGGARPAPRCTVQQGWRGVAVCVLCSTCCTAAAPLCCLALPRCRGVCVCLCCGWLPRLLPPEGARQQELLPGVCVVDGPRYQMPALYGLYTDGRTPLAEGWSIAGGSFAAVQLSPSGVPPRWIPSRLAHPHHARLVPVPKGLLVRLLLSTPAQALRGVNACPRLPLITLPLQGGFPGVACVCVCLECPASSGCWWACRRGAG